MSKKIEKNNFKVDLTGIIELLSEHIYSTPIIFIRELLQNATDAISAVQLTERDYKGRITVTINGGSAPYISFSDNGIGLTEEQIHSFLAVIGESSKRDSIYANSFIGKFGIGLLSCFMVSSKIELKTRSHLSKQAYIWTAYSNGTYQVTEIDEEIPFGTTVILHPKSESIYYFLPETIEKALNKYGEILPHSIELVKDDKKTTLNDPNPCWLNPVAPKSEWLDYGKKTFHKNFISAFYIDIPEVGLNGVCYIQDIKTQIAHKSQSKLFVKNMLVSDKNENILPDWAFFIQAVLNINDLSLTASRDAFVMDSFYKTAKEVIALEIKQKLQWIAQKDPLTFTKIVQSHTQSIKMLAVEDEVMLELFKDHLVFETNKGHKELKWIKEHHETMYYTMSNDDFKQIKRIATAQNIIVINACYSFESDILLKIVQKFPAYPIQVLSPFDLIKKIEVNQTELQSDEFAQFISKANTCLEPYFCEATISRFNPTDLPVLFVADEKSANQHKYHNQTKNTSNPFDNVIQNLNTIHQKPIICFNLNNELIRTLIYSEKNESIEPVVKLLYIQSLFLGQYPVQRNEMEVMNYSLTQLLKIK